MSKSLLPSEIHTCARAAHEANRAFCLWLGDTTQRSWDEAEEWQRESAIAGVRFYLDHDGKPEPGAQHEAWAADLRAAGWVYGEVKDAAAKTHPCLVPFSDLPPEQQAKDVLFICTVGAMVAALEVAARKPEVG